MGKTSENIHNRCPHVAEILILISLVKFGCRVESRHELPIEILMTSWI